MGEMPESVTDFQRGKYRGLIIAAVVVVVAVGAVLALSGVFEPKRPRQTIEDQPDNKEGGCPCQCDRSKAMTAELGAVGGDEALRRIDRSLFTIAEREEAGYVTDAMIRHRLRLLDVERELRRAGTITKPSAAPERRLPFSGAVARAAPDHVHLIEDGRVRVGLELIVHATTTEWIGERQKALEPCFVVSMQLENLTDHEHLLTRPAIEASVPLSVRRWYVLGDAGRPWDGRLAAGEVKSIRVIGSLDADVAAKTRVDATIRFDSVAVQASAIARSRWHRAETLIPTERRAARLLSR